MEVEELNGNLQPHVVLLSPQVHKKIHWFGIEITCDAPLNGRAVEAWRGDLKGSQRISPSLPKERNWKAQSQ